MFPKSKPRLKQSKLVCRFEVAFVGGCVVMVGCLDQGNEVPSWCGYKV